MFFFQIEQTDGTYHNSISHHNHRLLKTLSNYLRILFKELSHKENMLSNQSCDVMLCSKSDLKKYLGGAEIISYIFSTIYIFKLYLSINTIFFKIRIWWWIHNFFSWVPGILRYEFDFSYGLNLDILTFLSYNDIEKQNRVLMWIKLRIFSSIESLTIRETGKRIRSSSTMRTSWKKREWHDEH